MADREQTRRDAEDGHDEFGQRVLALLAELEQVQRERDDAIRQKNAAMVLANNGFADFEARLAKVPALVEALRLLADPKDERHLERHPSKIARDALAVWEQE